MKQFYFSFSLEYDEKTDVIGVVAEIPTEAPTLDGISSLSKRIMDEVKSKSAVLISCFPLDIDGKQEEKIDDEKFYQREFKSDEV